jgi:4-O-beta-D-mannosyl-D-glucose phosphorylase
MHVATTTIAKLVDYCMNTPEDKYRSAASVATRNELISNNLKVMEKFKLR